MNDKQLQFFAGLQKQMEGGAVQPEELIRVAKIIVEVVNGLIADLRNDVEGAKNEVSDSNSGFIQKLEDTNNSVQDILSRHYELQNKIAAISKSVPQQASDSANQFTTQQIEALRAALSSEINDLRSFIEGSTDVSGILDRLHTLETVGESSELIRNKLELLKNEDRLDASAIKNLPEATEKVVERVVGHTSLWTLYDVDVKGATNGQVLTYKAANNSWYPANAGSSSLTLTTTGTSGAATYSGGVLNIPVYSSGGGSGTVTSVASADGSVTVTNGTTTPDLAVVKAPKLTTGRTISITGDLTYTSPSFDGSGNVTAVGTLATVNSNVGTFNTLTVNAKGLVTAASNTSYQAPISLTTTGTGAATFVGNVLNIPTPAGGSSYWNRDAVNGYVYPTTLTDLIGIGTITPNHLLTISGADSNTSLTTTAIVEQNIVNTDTTVNNSAQLAFDTFDTGGTRVTGAKIAGVFTSHGVGTSSADTAFINKNAGTNQENMRLTSAGRLGIGTIAPGSLLDVSGSDSGTTITAASVAMGQVTNTNTTANNFSDMAFATFDLSSANIASSKIVGIHTSHTAGAVSGELSFMTRNAGTLSEAMHITSTNSVYVTSSSANAFAVGQAGITNPALNIDTSTASSATGINVKSAAAAGGIAITAISSGTNENLSIDPKGTGVLNLQTNTSGTFKLGNSSSASSSIVVGTTAALRFMVNATNFYTINSPVGANLFTGVANGTATTIRFGVTSNADTALTLSTEAPWTYFNGGTTRQHATGALTLQRDFRITGSNHTFVAASTLTDHAVFAIDFSTSAATNATITNSHAIYVPSVALGTGRTNSYGLTVNAATGATTNLAAQFLGGSVFFGNSTVIAGTPSGGGYLYVNAGALHWKGSSGTDTAIAPA